MVRLSSGLIPLATHPEWKYLWEDQQNREALERGFQKIGDAARNLDVRLSFHPGQFCVLASDNPDVVSRSVEEFEYHATMAKWMGYGKSFMDFKINVHISGKQGPQGIKDVLPRLSTEARNTLTIENDEFGWGLEHSLELAEHCALVLDLHHHFIRTGEYIQATDDRCKRVIDSWRGVRPVIHYSYSRDEHLPTDFNHDVMPDMNTLLAAGHKKQKLRAHSEMYPNRAVNQWALSHWDWADIQCEAKNKNLASRQLYEQAV
jgi:UV DNA damage repair endonuclease